MSSMNSGLARTRDGDALFAATGMPDRDWWQALWPDPATVLEALGLQAGIDVVDLCCGDGYFTGPLASLVSPGKVIAIDLDPAMLEQAKVACRDCANCIFSQTDARELASVIREPVDYVLIANTFHGVPDKVALAHAAFSVLKSGGRFAIVNWYPMPREQTTVFGAPRGPATVMRMSPEAVQALVEPVGFTLDRVVALPPYHYGALFVAKVDTIGSVH